MIKLAFIFNFRKPNLTMNHPKRNILLPGIILSNLFPLYGVLQYHWTIFSVVYIYWIELLIITFFLILKMLFASGDEQVTFSGKVWLAAKFLLFRCGIFLFYLLFIVVFLGLMVSAKDTSSSMNMMQALLLRGSFYYYTILSFILYNLVEFIVWYMASGKYRTAKPNDYFIILDPHILVVHIVVVLGTFLYQGATEQLHWNHKNSMIACVSLFVVVKIIADTLKERFSSDTNMPETGKYI